MVLVLGLNDTFGLFVISRDDYEYSIYFVAFFKKVLATFNVDFFFNIDNFLNTATDVEIANKVLILLAILRNVYIHVIYMEEEGFYVIVSAIRNRKCP